MAQPTTAPVRIPKILGSNDAKSETSGRPIIGEGPWPALLYLDYQCRRSARLALALAGDERLSVVLKHFPLSYHPLAREAADRIAGATGNTATASHQALIRRGGALEPSDISQLAAATEAGIRIVNRDIADGRASGVTATPALFVGGRQIHLDPMQPTASVTAAIEALKRSGVTPTFP